VRGWNGEKRPTRGRLQEKLREEKAGREGIRLEMAIGGERMERGEETYPGKTAGGDERETGVEGETDNSIRASKGPVPSIFSSWSFFNSFLPFPGLSLTPFQPIPGPASTSLHPSPVSL